MLLGRDKTVADGAAISVRASTLAMTPIPADWSTCLNPLRTRGQSPANVTRMAVI